MMDGPWYMVIFWAIFVGIGFQLGSALIIGLLGLMKRGG
jgi:hypothetical protein